MQVEAAVSLVLEVLLRAQRGLGPALVHDCLLPLHYGPDVCSATDEIKSSTLSSTVESLGTDSHSQDLVFSF